MVSVIAPAFGSMDTRTRWISLFLIILFPIVDCMAVGAPIELCCSACCAKGDCGARPDRKMPDAGALLGSVPTNLVMLSYLIRSSHIEKLLRSKFEGPNAIGSPYVFDIRGGGMFWAVEFDFSGPEADSLDFGKDQFAMIVQARALEKDVIVMGMTGGANLQGTEGNHIIIAPAYNVTPEQLENIVDIFGDTVAEVLESHKK